MKRLSNYCTMGFCNKLLLLCYLRFSVLAIDLIENAQIIGKYRDRAPIDAQNVDVHGIPAWSCINVIIEFSMVENPVLVEISAFFR
jgi:hypothetical protein